jgi:hypothetical protein
MSFFIEHGTFLSKSLMGSDFIEAVAGLNYYLFSPTEIFAIKKS